MIHTFCAFNLGDNLLHLNYLRKVAAENPNETFVHAAPAAQLSQLRETVADIPTISLIDLSQKDGSAVDVWKNRRGDFFGHGKRNNWAAFYLEFFERLSADLGVKNPVTRPSDFLFDYPAITAKEYPAIDCLVINSTPHSGQFKNFWPEQMDLVIGKLKAKGHSVVTTSRSSHDVPCTQSYSPPMSVSEIGTLSLRCKYIFGVATGPIWPTFNVWNLSSVELRVLMLDGERIEIAPNTYHVETIWGGAKILEEHGIL